MLENIKVTEWDITDGGFIFEIRAGLGMAYVKRFHDGTYQHFTADFTPVELTANAASNREIVVASYMATHNVR